MLAAFSNVAQAQKVDLAFGLSTTDAPGASSTSGNHQPVSLSGGAYTGISGDVQFLHNFGIGAEINWRASQGEWGGYQPYRPIFYDVNAVYSPKLVDHVYLELQGGIGALSTRFYTQNQTCDFYTCTNYNSDNHFAEHVGGGLKFYPKGGFFVRPEAHLYIVNNNLYFSADRVFRYGLSIGYTFGQH